LSLDVRRTKHSTKIREFQKEIVRLNQEGDEDLRKSLMHDKLYSLRGNPPSDYVYSAYIYEALGDYEMALVGFKALLRYYDRRDNELASLDVLADIGSSFVARGLCDRSSRLIRLGLRHLRDSYETCSKKYFWSPNYIMVGKEYAKRLISIGDVATAETLLAQCLSEAKKRKLLQQAETIQTLQNEARSLSF
jgi:tetratricopeptide (TPR) repeat protein